MLVCVFLHNFAHETAGAARIRLSLRPLFGEGTEFSLQTPGGSRRGNANACTVISPPSTRSCAWWGGVGGGGSIGVVLCQRVCGCTPHPAPSPPLRGGRGEMMGGCLKIESVAIDGARASATFSTVIACN